MTMNDRDEFEKLFPVPLGVKWCERQQDYTYENYRALDSAVSYSGKWQAWQAAHAQGGGEPVAWRVSHPEKAWVVYDEYPDWAEGCYEIEPLYTQPQPAQQGSTHAPTDDRVQRAMQMPLKELATKFIEATDRASRNMDALKAAQPAVPEEWREVLAGCVTCFNYPEWSDKCEEYERRARELLSTPTTPRADGWVRCEYRLPTEDEEDERNELWTCLKDVNGKYHISRSNNAAFIEAFCRQYSRKDFWWMPTGLKRPQPPK